MRNLFLCTLLSIPFFISAQNKVYHSTEDTDSPIIDTFHIQNNFFRIITDTTETAENKFLLQRFINNQWVNRFHFGSGVGMHAPHYDRKSDLNLDGNNDLIVYNRNKTDAYLFDNLTNDFISKSSTPPYEWSFIDSSKKLLCSLDFDLKTEDGISLIYKYSNFKVYPFYLLLIKDDSNGAKKKCTLYKCVNGDLKNRVKISENEIISNSFDLYLDFWKTRYRKLMGYN